MYRPPIRRTVHVVAISRTANIAATVFSVSFMAMALELKVSAWKSLIFRVMTDYRSETLKAAKHVSETLCEIAVLRKGAAVGVAQKTKPRRSGVLPEELHIQQQTRETNAISVPDGVV